MMRFSRRRFLQVGGTAAAAAVVPTAKAAECSAKLPASIPKLQSMKDQAKPISAEEGAARVERARQLMEENRLQAIVVTYGSSLPYYSAVHWWPSERFFAMVLPAKGNVFFVCPAFEEGRAREQLAIGPFGAKADV